MTYVHHPSESTRHPHKVSIILYGEESQDSKSHPVVSGCIGFPLLLYKRPQTWWLKIWLYYLLALDVRSPKIKAGLDSFLGLQDRISFLSAAVSRGHLHSLAHGPIPIFKANDISDPFPFTTSPATAGKASLLLQTQVIRLGPSEYYRTFCCIKICTLTQLAVPLAV